MIGPLVMFLACSVTPAGNSPEIPVADCTIHHKIFKQQTPDESVNKPAADNVNNSSEQGSGNSNPADVSVPAAPSGTATPDNNPAY